MTASYFLHSAVADNILDGERLEILGNTLQFSVKYTRRKSIPRLFESVLN